jgi:hypothetical protein
MMERIAKKDPNLWVSLFLLILSVGVANGAYRLGLGNPHSPGPGFMFFGASVILGLLSLHLLFKYLLATEQKGESIWRGKRLGRSAGFFLALVLYNLLFERLGYLLTTFFFLIFLFWLTGAGGEGRGRKREWVLILGGSALTSFLSYLIFSRLFMLMFPKGLIKFF